MKVNDHYLISLVAQFSIVTFIIAGLIFETPGVLEAGGVNFSRKWRTIQTSATIGTSEDKIREEVMKCEFVRAYADMEGNLHGATIDDAHHSKDTDRTLTISVRLYKNGIHGKSCNVHINEGNAFKKCSCEQKVEQGSPLHP